VTLTTAGFAKIQSHQLDHVGLEEVDVPPRSPFTLGHSASFRREEVAGAAIDRSFGHTSESHARLHGRFAGSHIQHCNSIYNDETTRKKTYSHKRTKRTSRLTAAEGKIHLTVT